MAAPIRKKRPVAQSSGRTKRRNSVAAPKSTGNETGKPEVRVFVSYSHQDERAEEKLYTHLAPWRNDGVSVWHDKRIETGGELDTAIARELRRAHIFVALLSPAYLDSNYCWNIEYKRAMSRRARALMRVVAVVVKPCSWKRTSAARFKLLPKDGVPPERWSSSDAAFVNVAEGIGEVIKLVRRELAAQPVVRSRAAPKAKIKPKPKPKPKSPAATPARPSKARATSASKPPKLRASSRKRPTTG